MKNARYVTRKFSQKIVPQTWLLKNRTTATANVEEFHASFRRPLLRLEEDRLTLVTVWTLLVRPWQLRSEAMLAQCLKVAAHVAFIIPPENSLRRQHLNPLLPTLQAEPSKLQDPPACLSLPETRGHLDPPYPAVIRSLHRKKCRSRDGN